MIHPSKMCSENSGSAPPGAELISGHEHLLIEILIRLTAKSLMKFKSVCKSWNFLISSRQFSLLHLRHCSSSDPIPVSGILFRRTCAPSSYSYQYLSVNPLSISSASSFRIPGSVISVLQSCNGLLLYYSFNSSDSRVLNLGVYNPTTGQVRTLPSIQSSFVSAALAFNPHGYKVISIHTTLLSHYYTVKIYSSVTICWKESDARIRVSHDMEFQNGVFWRGNVHWVSRSEHSSFYFVVDKERVMKMPSPSVPTSDRGYMKCSECKERLCCLWNRKNDMVLKFFTLESYDEGWFLKFTFNLGVVKRECSLLGTSYSNFSAFCLINSTRCNGEDGYMIVFHVASKILIYDYEDETCKGICNIPSSIEGEVLGKEQFYWFDAYPYSFSLAQV